MGIWVAIQAFFKGEHVAAQVLKVVTALGMAIYLVACVWQQWHPRPTTAQKAETIINIYEFPSERKFGLAATICGIDIGVTKYGYPDKPVLKKTILK